MTCQYLGSNDDLEFWDEEDYVGDWTIQSIRCEVTAEAKDSEENQEDNATGLESEEDIFNHELHSII